jgi:hypothetical protein
MNSMKTNQLSLYFGHIPDGGPPGAPGGPLGGGPININSKFKNKINRNI